MDMRNAKLKYSGQEQRPVLDQTRFYQRMNALKREAHGRILEGRRLVGMDFARTGCEATCGSRLNKPALNWVLITISLKNPTTANA